MRATGGKATSIDVAPRLLQLLLGPQVVGVSTFGLPAIGSTWMQPCVTLAANHLVTVVLLRQNPQRGLNDAAPQSQHQMEGGLLLDVVVGEGASILQLFTSEDETLLVGRDALLVLNLRLHILDRVRGLNLEGDGFAGESFHENLHCGVSVNKSHIQLSDLITNLIFAKNKFCCKYT